MKLEYIRSLSSSNYSFVLFCFFKKEQYISLHILAIHKAQLVSILMRRQSQQSPTMLEVLGVGGDRLYLIQNDSAASLRDGSSL